MSFQFHARSLVNWLFVSLGTIGVLLAFLINKGSTILSGLMLNIGATLIATSLLAFLYQHLGERSFADQLRELRDSFEIVRKSFQLGIEEVWSQRRDIPKAMWNQFTEKASGEVMLLGVAEYGFAEDRGFWRIVEKGVNYRFLLLDPDSEFAAHWDDRDITGLVPSKIRGAIQRFTQIIEANKRGPGSIELRVYSEAPSMSLVKADYEMIVTLYIPAFQGDDCFTMRLQDVPNGFYARYQEQFERLWNPARVMAATKKGRARKNREGAETHNQPLKRTPDGAA